MYAPPVHSRREAIEAVSRFCDVSERLRTLPTSAAVRGLYFRSIEAVLADAGRLEAYRVLFPERVSSVTWQPMTEFLVRLTVGSALLAGPERVHEGMFAIGRHNAGAFANSLLGKVLLRFLSREPRKLLAQAMAGRRQSHSPGHWELSFPSERTALLRMYDEYLYLESYMLGAAYGTFDLIGMRVQATAELKGPFTGTHTLHWGGRSARCRVRPLHAPRLFHESPTPRNY
jgi:uncharacterized protein (TIGR02265 family)